MPRALASRTAWRERSAVLWLSAGVMPLMWNQSAPSKTDSQSKSAGPAIQPLQDRLLRSIKALPLPVPNGCPNKHVALDPFLLRLVAAGDQAAGPDQPKRARARWVSQVTPGQVAGHVQ